MSATNLRLVRLDGIELDRLDGSTSRTETTSTESSALLGRVSRRSECGKRVCTAAIVVGIVALFALAIYVIAITRDCPKGESLYGQAPAIGHCYCAPTNATLLRCISSPEDPTGS